MCPYDTEDLVLCLNKQVHNSRMIKGVLTKFKLYVVYCGKKRLIKNFKIFGNGKLKLQHGNPKFVTWYLLI